MRACDNPSPANNGNYCGREGGLLHERRESCNDKGCIDGHDQSCRGTDKCGPEGVQCLYLDGGRNYTCLEDLNYRRVTTADGRFLRVEDIDECAETGFWRHNCPPEATCINTPGYFTCECNTGYKEQGISNCVDDDECRNTSVCTGHKECKNTVGSYLCVCKPGYDMKASTGECLEKRLLPFGSAVGDTEVTSVSHKTEERISGLIRVPQGLPVFGQKLCENIYVAENGLLVVTNTPINQQQNETFPQTQPLTGPVLEGTDPDVCGILASFWADSSTETEFHKVFYQTYEDVTDSMFTQVNNMLSELGVNMSTTFILKVTWSNMAPQYASETSQRNTFQAIVVTDCIHTYIINIYYDMQWVPNGYDSEVLQVKYKGFPARVGYHFRNNGTGNSSYEEPSSGHYSSRPDEPNVYRLHEKTVQEHGKQGFIIYRLDDNNDDDNLTFVNSRCMCKAWYEAQPDVSEWAANLLGSCPPTLAQAIQDDYFFQSPLKFNNNYTFEKVPNQQGVTVRCVYRPEDGTLVRFPPAAATYDQLGVLVRYSLNETLHQSEEVVPYDLCCLQTGSQSFRFCQMFFEKRPNVDSSRYVDRQLATSIGDPHLVTLDDFLYTFSGFGEYYMVRSLAGAPVYINIQLRLILSPTLPNANRQSTIISGVAASVGAAGTSQMQVYLTGADTLQVWVDDGPYTPSTVLRGAALNLLSHRAVVLFDDGVTLDVTARDHRLAVRVAIASSLRTGQLSGLLGDFDGDLTNDLVDGHGFQYDPLTVTPQQLYQFGETWSLRNLHGPTHANDATLFRWYVNPEDANNFFDDQYSPYFLDDTPPTAQEMSVCGVPGQAHPDPSCLYDLRVTGDETLAQNTRDVLLALPQEKADLSNFPPEFTSRTPRRLTVTAGQAKNIVVAAKDSHQGGQVTVYIVLVDGSGERTQRAVPVTPDPLDPDLYTGVYHWVPHADCVYVEFVAADSDNVLSVLVPEVIVCVCQNDAFCDWNVVQNRQMMCSQATCVCQAGWTGPICDKDVDACHPNPCYGECTDRSPDESRFDGKEFVCEACPDGMEGNGVACTDVNECVLPSSDSRKHKCDQICVNTFGGYACQSQEGWWLDADGYTSIDRPECQIAPLNDCDSKFGTCTDLPLGSHTCGCELGYVPDDNNNCQDLDECRGAHGCDGGCVNTVGSFRCTCPGGLKVDPTNSSRCIDDDMCAVENDPACKGGCVNAGSYYTCTCPTPLALNEDGVTCDGSCQFELCEFGKCETVNSQEQCFCGKGYQVDLEPQPSGVTQCSNVDECEVGLSQCDNFAECRDNDGSYICVCKSGFQRVSLGSKACEDKDECAPPNVVQCDQTCVNTLGSFKCECSKGWVLHSNGYSCIDIDESLPGVPRDCSHYATVINLPGTYDCHCLPGYTGDGFRCYELDECLTDNGGCEGSCTNLPGSFSCSCAQGYQLVNQFSCVEVDECARPLPPCEQGCVNVDRSYYCYAFDGFRLNSDGHTVTALEVCSNADPGSDCGEAGRCYVDGGLHCLCLNGATFNGTSGKCIDDDECQGIPLAPGMTLPPYLRRPPTTLAPMTTDTATAYTDNGTLVTTADVTSAPPTTSGVPVYFTHLCAVYTNPADVRCENTVGGYRCVPPPGYLLLADGFTAVDINECHTVDASQRHDCDLVSTDCVNSPGRYSCPCKEGFTSIVGNRRRCEDLDECKGERVGVQAGCHEDLADCTNELGNFRCDCKPGYEGDGIQCTDVDECARAELNQCDTDHQLCVNANGTYTCDCYNGFKKDFNSGTCININECTNTELSQVCEFICEDASPGFRCSCPAEGFIPNFIDGHVKCIVSSPCQSSIMTTACNHVCININGVDKCVCYRGYQETNNYCYDIDECSTNTHSCGVNSECKNNVGGYTCTCHRDYLIDVDGLACSETDGNWGVWSQWTTCSRACHGRFSRSRTCDEPPPTGTRFCPGEDLDHAMCNYLKPTCTVEPWEAVESFMIFMHMDIARFEDVQHVLFATICKLLQDFCTASELNFDRCCRRNPNAEGIPVTQDMCVLNDVHLGRGYPRTDGSQTRALVQITVPSANPLCGQIPDAEERYHVPSALLIEVLDTPSARARVKLELEEAGLGASLAAGSSQYEVKEGYNEDLAATTPRPLVSVGGLSVVTTSLAVFFALLGASCLGVGVFFLLRSPYKPIDKDEESRATTPVEAFIAPADTEQAKMRRRHRADMRKKAMVGPGPPAYPVDDDDPSKSQILDPHLRSEDDPDDTLPSLGRTTPTSRTSLVQDKD